MGILSDGQGMLNRRLKASEGMPCTYSRKVGQNTYTAEIIARVGRTVFSGLTESSVSVQFGESDFLIEVADLVINDQPTTPQRGDRITKEDGSVFELASPQTDEPCWRYSDITRTVYRVHTQRV